MIIKKTFPAGAWEIFDIRGNEICRKIYFFYTKKEAIAEFRAEFPLRKKRGAK